MIISHKFKFIFIKTRKTAGTSIEVALSKLCGDDDIVTPIWPAVEGHKPRNYKKFHELKGFYNHIPASEIMGKIPREVWDSYYKFCFERNPFDKVVSWYFWNRLASNIKIDFTMFCLQCHDRAFKEGFPVDFEKYGFEDKNSIPRLHVDFVGKYETLLADLTRVCEKLGISFDGNLTREKSALRPSDSDYKRYYTPELQELVSKEFKREIQLFGYTF